MKWSPAMLKFVWDNCENLNDLELAAALSRVIGENVSLYSIQHIRRRLGIRKARGRGACEAKFPDEPGDEKPPADESGRFS